MSMQQAFSNEPMFYIGLDLAQSKDFTAAVIIEPQIWFSEAALTNRTWRGLRPGWVAPSDAFASGGLYPLELALGTDDSTWPTRPPLHLRHVARWRGESYISIVEHVRRLVDALPAVLGVALVVDATGVGRAVVDILREAELEVVPVTITSGNAVNRGSGGMWNVPKTELISCVQAALQSRRLQIAHELPHADTLVRELENFRISVDPRTRNATMSAWREGLHDDLVLAASLALWWRDRWKRWDAERTSRTPLSDDSYALTPAARRGGH